MQADRPVLGVALMLGFCLVVPFSDAFAKLAGATLPLAMLLVARLGVQSIALTPVAYITGAGLRLSRRLFLWTVVRSFLNLAGIAAIYASFRVLPLADAIAIAYVMPFILLFLGHFLMGEDVGPRRVLAALVGFLGTLLVVQPSFAEVGLIALLLVLAAFLFAFFILVTRIVAREADPVALQAVSGWLSLLMLVPLMIIGTGLGLEDLSYRLPIGEEIWWLLGIGVCGTVAHVFMTSSLRFAPSSTVCTGAIP